MPEPALAQAAAALARPALHVVPPAAVPRLDVSGYDLHAALRLRHQLGISHVLAQILVRRGFSDVEAVRDFLEAGEQHSPTAFAGIERALSVIERHISSASRITVHGDYDVDGVCATALMVRALRELGARVDWLLPSRMDDGYGFTASTVRRLAERGTQLVITVDCGITAVEEAAQAAAAGIDLVVTDHHRPRADRALPSCPLVHPTICGYPCPHLCATGVAYKLASALGARSAEEDLELVALATVADLVPLHGENRRMVRAGLRSLADTQKQGLRALMSVAGCDPSGLDARTLGFRLAPRINAAGRLARADAGVELLLCEEEGRAHEIACELDRLNSERRSLEQRITWEAQAQVDQLGDRSGYVLAGEGWHPGVIGIVASRIVERHHRPAILVAIADEELAQGSARSVPGFDLLAALEACSDHLERYGGHRAAAGLTIRRGEVPAFREAFEAHAAAVLTADLRQPVESVDAIVSGSDLGLALAEELELLEPSGIGAPRPRLMVPGARFENCRPMGEGRHARFTVVAGGSRTPAVAFGCGGSVDAEPGEPVDACFVLERNCWNGVIEPRLRLRQAWPCTPTPIEVLGQDEEYLTTVLAELERTLDDPDPPEDGGRTMLDRRGESPLAVLADAVASASRMSRAQPFAPSAIGASDAERSADSSVLAVCADVPRRLDGLRSRCGGFSLICYEALESDPSPVRCAEHVVALDPPASKAQAALLRVGQGFTHMGWGKAELRFAQHMHELEYGLRGSLKAFYRALRARGRVAGDDVASVLRGEGAHGRSPRLGGRLVRVLTELELVQLDPILPALATTDGPPTSLGSSPAYRAYAKRYEDGRLFLSSASLLPGG